MDSRKEELERKRKKLEELRKAREERQKSTSSSTSPALSNIKRPSLKKTDEQLVPQLKSETVRQEVDDLVASLVGTPAIPHKQKEGVDISISVPSALQQSLQTDGKGISGSKPTLSFHETVLFDLPPKVAICYNKEVQVEQASVLDPKLIEDQLKEKERTLRKQIAEEEAFKFQQKLQEERKLNEAAEKEQNSQVKTLSDEEKRNIVSSEQFASFLEQSSRIVERVLNIPYDATIDYSMVEDTSAIEDREAVNKVCKFYHERWSKNRTVSSLDWSHVYPELSLAGYGQNPSVIKDADGLALVWNVHMTDRPEYVFQAQSEVTSAIFSPYHPNLVIGGLFSGQIVIWDTRTRWMPVLKSSTFSKTHKAHTHPICAMQVVGTQNAHNLVTVSSEGLMCSWQLDMLANPLSSTSLTRGSQQNGTDVFVTCMNIPHGETGEVWVGTNEGDVFQAHREDRAGAKAGIVPGIHYKSHFGTITGIHFQTLMGASASADLFLTSGIDWSVKLWKRTHLNSVEDSANVQSISPMMTFDNNEDYVFDVKWSPTNPALFAMVTGAGRFDIWNLCANQESPVNSIQVTDGEPLSSLSWDKSGKRCSVGAGSGSVYVYDIGELAFPRPEDYSRLKKLIQ